MAAIIKTPTTTYRVIGATDDCTTCDRCGKPHCLHLYPTRAAVFLDIARTVAELEAAVRIPTRP